MKNKIKEYLDSIKCIDDLPKEDNFFLEEIKVGKKIGVPYKDYNQENDKLYFTFSFQTPEQIGDLENGIIPEFDLYVLKFNKETKIRE